MPQTDVSDMLMSIQTIYNTMIDMEHETSVPPLARQESINLGCLAIVSGIEYMNAVKEFHWISDTEELQLTLANEYATWRLENKTNDLQ